MTASTILCAIWLAAASADGAAFAGPSEWKRHADPAAGLLGEPFTYTIVLNHPPTHRYELSRPGDLGPFEILEEKRERQDGKTVATTTFRLKMSAFALGKQRIPDLPFEVSTDEGARTWTLPGTEFESKGSLDDKAEQEGENLYDIRPPEEVAIRSWRILYALLGLAAAAALAYGAWRLWKRLRRERPVVAPPPQPSHVRALAALDALAKEGLPAAGQYQAFWFRLSEILRGYLGEQYQFEALESTTYELLDRLRTLHTPGLPMDDVVSFCNEADLVKFARMPSTPDRCKSALDFGYRLVHLTTAEPTHSGVEPAPHGTDAGPRAS